MTDLNDEDAVEYVENDKINAAVLGATGMVGQVFLYLLAGHQRFELSVITGSGTRTGKTYSEEVKWVLPLPMPANLNNIKLDALDTGLLKERGVRIVFSALPAGVAAEVEPVLRKQGFYVFSNAGAMRYEEDVPILIPEVNPEALNRIEEQGFPGSGFVATNANCSTTGLAAALAPLKRFDIKEVFVSTYQSVSGAGYPGMSCMDILGNAIPYIDNEEEKMQKELEKILGLGADVFPYCVRIPVLFGHLETVWLSFGQTVETGDILEAWQDFSFDNRSCPGIPEQPVVYCNEKDAPQPAMSFLGHPPGMQVFTGRLKKESDGKRIGFTLLVNNLVKGAAGGSIGNAELFLAKYGSRIDID